MSQVTSQDLDRRFDHHPSENAFVSETHSKIRHGVKLTALRIVELVPDGREQDFALSKLEEALMWADKGIAMHQKNSARDP